MNWMHRDGGGSGNSHEGRVKRLREVHVAQSTCLAGWEVAPCGHLGQNLDVRS